MKVDEDNGKSEGMVKLWNQKVRKFSINEFWENTVCLVSATYFDFGVSKMWYK